MPTSKSQYYKTKKKSNFYQFKLQTCILYLKYPLNSYDKSSNMIDMAPLTTLQDLQKKVYAELLDAAVLALEKDEMTAEDSEKSSRSIIRNLDGLESYTELIFFLRDLASQYPAYRSTYITYKQNEVAIKDQKKLEEVQAKLQQLTGLGIHS